MATDHDITILRFMPQDAAGPAPMRKTDGGSGRYVRHVDDGGEGTSLSEDSVGLRRGCETGKDESRAGKRRKCGTRAYYKEAKKEAKAEFKDITDGLAKAYDRSLEEAQRQYLDNAEWSKELYEMARQEAKERYDKAVEVARSKYEFTVDIAREQYRDSKTDVGG